LILEVEIFELFVSGALNIKPKIVAIAHEQW
jgi:hypothetical protein